jgi:hypothetical protein
VLFSCLSKIARWVLCTENSLCLSQKNK